MLTYDEGLRRVAELAAEVEKGVHASINEDTTRLRFIDALLFECLDWDRYSQVETEERTDVGVIDYSMTLDVPLLVVEAKKVGIAFSLPVEQEKRGRLLRSVASVASLNKGVEQALSQAAGYALEKGVPFAAVSNGWQVIAFCTQLTAGVSWRKGQALVFENLSVVHDNFLEFWNALSVEAVRRFQLRERVSELLTTKTAPRRSASIKNYDRNKNRNEFQADLQMLGDLVFGGSLFEDRQLFHDHCYCAAGAIPQFSQASRSYLEDRYPEFFSSTAHTPTLEPAQTKKGPAGSLTNLTNIRKPILLLGDVGVGKTTFLEHLFLVEWADKKDELIVIRVDLADKPSRVEDLPNVVAQEIERSLLLHYNIDINESGFLCGAYRAELARFRKSPEGMAAGADEQALAYAEAAYLKDLRSRFDDHLRAVFSHLIKGRRKMVVLIFDNVDQRPPKMQASTFIQAQIAASTWDVFVVIALRPETFVRAKLAGEISGYHPRAFTIAPPRFDQLIEKRITTAIRMMKGELSIPNIGTGVTVQLSNVADYLDVLRHSFASDPELLGFCEDISGGNMRLALDYIIAFMSCGHVDARKILERWRDPREYTIPLHEFVRGVMFAEREYYSGEAAMIMNIYDCRTGDTKESFAVLSILTLLTAAMRDVKPSAADAGYSGIEETKRNLVAAGYRHEQACWAMDLCLEHRLLETNLKSGGFDGATHVRITPTGSYYYAKLVRTFAYTDAVCLDTPIDEKDYFDGVVDTALLTGRLERVGVFVRYLDALYGRHPTLRSVSSWAEVARDLREDLRRAKDNNDRAALRRSATDAPSPP